MQPVTIRRRSDVREIELNGVIIKSEKYEIVAGERRWRAAKKAGLAKIPCVIIGADDKNAAIVSLIENLQREDLEFFDRAEALKRVQEQFGISKVELSRRLCMTQDDIEKSLELLDLNADERTIIRCAKLTEAHARLFLRVDDDELRLLLLKKAASRRLSVSACELLIDKMLAERSEQERQKNGEGIKYAFRIKDIRFFLNSVERSVKMLTQAGVPVVSEQHEEDDFLEIKLRVPKTSTAASFCTTAK